MRRLRGAMAAVLTAGAFMAGPPPAASVAAPTAAEVAAGVTAEPTGEQIMRRIIAEDGVGDERAHVTFKQVGADKREQTTFGLLHYKQSEPRGDSPSSSRGAAGKILFTVLTPPRLSGLGFLAWTYPEPGRPPDQWLYLPELRQVRRITPRDPLEGTADTVLTFADMRPRPVEEERHTLLRSEPLFGRPCWVVESRPRGAPEAATYRRRLLWVDQQRLLVLKVEYYDRKDALLKTQMIGWQRLPSPCAPCGPVQGRDPIASVWTWSGSEVINVQTGQRTSLSLHVLALNTGLSDDLFTERTLRAGPPP